MKELNRLRNRFVHEITYDPSFDEVHAITVEAGRAGVDFSDGLDSPDLRYVKSLSYDRYMLMNALFRNVFCALVWSQGREFWNGFFC